LIIQKNFFYIIIVYYGFFYNFYIFLSINFVSKLLAHIMNNGAGNIGIRDIHKRIIMRKIWGIIFMKSIFLFVNHRDFLARLGLFIKREFFFISGLGMIRPGSEFLFTVLVFFGFFKKFSPCSLRDGGLFLYIIRVIIWIIVLIKFKYS
jgi:hypothetical protein